MLRDFDVILLGNGPVPVGKPVSNKILLSVPDDEYRAIRQGLEPLPRKREPEYWRLQSRLRDRTHMCNVGPSIRVLCGAGPTSEEVGNYRNNRQNQQKVN